MLGSLVPTLLFSLDSVSRLALPPRRAQEQIGFDALLLCDDADLKKLRLRKGLRVKILGMMRGWAATELARLR